MKYYVSIAVLTVSLLTNCIQWKSNSEEDPKTENHESITSEGDQLDLGVFSLSLSVKDLAVSKEFYENLGFEVLAGSFDINYFIMKNDTKLIGLFYGMFEGNILTFNPGWDVNGQAVENYDDIRDIHKHLIGKGVKINDGMDMKESGPSSMMITDPDGNLILFDQHL